MVAGQLDIHVVPRNTISLQFYGQKCDCMFEGSDCHHLFPGMSLSTVNQQTHSGVRQIHNSTQPSIYSSCSLPSKEVLDVTCSLQEILGIEKQTKWHQEEATKQILGGEAFCRATGQFSSVWIFLKSQNCQIKEI